MIKCKRKRKWKKKHTFHARKIQKPKLLCFALLAHINDKTQKDQRKWKKRLPGRPTKKKPLMKRSHLRRKTHGGDKQGQHTELISHTVTLPCPLWPTLTLHSISSFAVSALTQVMYCSTGLVENWVPCWTWSALFAASSGIITLSKLNMVRNLTWIAI